MWDTDPLLSFFIRVSRFFYWRDCLFLIMSSQHLFQRSMGHKCMNFFWGSLLQQVLVKISLCSTCLRFFWDLYVSGCLFPSSRLRSFLSLFFFFLFFLSFCHYFFKWAYCPFLLLCFGNSCNVYINSLVVYSQVPYVFFVFFILFFFF